MDAAAKLTASNGGPGDFFGDMVAISGSTAVVGAPLKNSSTGAAYVFERTGTSWSQQARLTDPDAARGDFFGSSVAISRSAAIVGAPRKDSLTGAAYVFERTGTEWSQKARLTDRSCRRGRFLRLLGSDLGLHRGRRRAPQGLAHRGGVCVRAHGNRVVAAGEADGPSRHRGRRFRLLGGDLGLHGDRGRPRKNSGAGAAYVFERTGTDWSQQAKLTPSHPAANEAAGSSVAISGSTALIGAPDKNSRAGDAYVFGRSGTAWSQQATPSTSGVAALGWSVAISGSTAVIGAPDTNSRAGAAYVFERTGTEWSQQAKLTASHPAAGEEFGHSVAISGSTALIGAPGNGAGDAYVFERTGTAWSQQAKLTASHPAAGEEFGHSVAISGSTALIGAPGKGGGDAYVFERTGTAWSQQAKLTASTPPRAKSLATRWRSRARPLSSALRENGAGAAYVFERTGTAWTQHAKLTAPTPRRATQFGWSVAVSGSTAVIGRSRQKRLLGRRTCSSAREPRGLSTPS